MTILQIPFAKYPLSALRACAFLKGRVWRLGVTILLGCGLAGCRPASLSEQSQAPVPTEHQTMQGVGKKFPVKASALSFQITKPTGDTWKLLAKHATLNADQSRADLQEVSGTIYDTHRQAIGTFVSKTGVYFPKTQAVTLKQAVRLHSLQNNVTLESQTLDFSAKQQWVDAYGGVTITYPSKAVLTGAKVSFDTGFQQMTLTGATQTALSL